MFDSWRFILRHPLSRGRRFAVLMGWMRWQLGSRLLPGPVVVPFVNDTSLLVEPGMTGATGNVYVGLHEFEDMAFVLHGLRPGGVFVDIGANVGVYTILASAAVGAHSVTIEAVPATYQKMMLNLRLNDILQRVEACNIALGAENGEVRFTTGLDTVNHVAAAGEEAGAMVVPVQTLDAVLAGRQPSLIKIDVEGFELPVLRGAHKTLSLDAPMAVIVELNDSGRRYGFNDEAVHQSLVGYGFAPVRYAPWTRGLVALDGPNRGSGNTIYVKEKYLEQFRHDLKAAPKVRVQGWEI